MTGKTTQFTLDTPPLLCRYSGSGEPSEHFPRKNVQKQYSLLREHQRFLLKDSLGCRDKMVFKSSRYTKTMLERTGYPLHTRVSTKLTSLNMKHTRNSKTSFFLLLQSVLALALHKHFTNNLIIQTTLLLRKHPLLSKHLC